MPNTLLSYKQFNDELIRLAHQIKLSKILDCERGNGMAIKALAQRKAKPAVRTLADLLAQVFTDSKFFAGTFYPEGFQIDRDSIRYETDAISDFHDHGTDASGGEEFVAPFDCTQTAYCCGLVEIGKFRDGGMTRDDAVNNALMRVFMACIGRAYNMVFATLVPAQKEIRTILLGVGFDSVAEYKSKGTGATITVLMRDAAANKDLPPGDLDLDYFNIDE